MGFRKHRFEQDIFEVSFADRLGPDETLGGVYALTVSRTRSGNGERVDISTDIVGTYSITGGNTVQFALGGVEVSDGPDKQPACPTCMVFVQVTTSQDRTLVAEVDLDIYE